MMTSTFHSSRSNQSLYTKQTRCETKEIQTKKESLMALESALKKRISEFRELCLKEAELTGHIPNDYPLHPREPIPQIRRRINSNTNVNNNLSENISIIPPNSLNKSRNHNSQHQQTFLVPSQQLHQFPSRPTSTNSTSSSLSTTSTNTRSSHNNYTINNNNLHLSNTSSNNTNLQQKNNILINDGYLNNNISNNFDKFDSLINSQQRLSQNRHDQASLISNNFKKPHTITTNPTFDCDTLCQMRASSTASSLSSSGSGASSTISTATVPSSKISSSLNQHLHFRSYSENISGTEPNVFLIKTTTNQINPRSMSSMQARTIKSNDHNNPHCTSKSQNKGIGEISVDNKSIMLKQTQYNNEKKSELTNGIDKTTTVNSIKPLQHKINGIGNYRPYYEETKPFQMSDFYKYSSKHRQKVMSSNGVDVDIHNNFNETTNKSFANKTTRQLQEDVMKKNSLKFNSCDEQIQASVKLIEKSGQKLIAATARAIAGNPGLAEKLSNILPNSNNGERY